MGTQEWLTTAEVAERLRMRPDSIARKIKRGEIPIVKVGKQWLIRGDRDDIGNITERVRMAITLDQYGWHSTDDRFLFGTVPESRTWYCLHLVDTMHHRGESLCGLPIDSSHLTETSTT